MRSPLLIALAAAFGLALSSAPTLASRSYDQPYFRDHHEWEWRHHREIERERAWQWHHHPRCHWVWTGYRSIQACE